MKLAVVHFFAILLANSHHLQAEECMTGFSVVAPELAVPGKATAVLVTLHGPGSIQPTNVTLRLLGDGAEELNQLLVQTTQEITGHGILPLEVPADAAGSYILQTLVNCSGSDDCSLQSSSQMKLMGPVRDVIIRPARHAYRPGESMSFWVLALDHDLQIAAGVTGAVSVRDPAGTKVALWDEVPLDQGVQSFSLVLSERATLGRWRLQVEVDTADFSVEVDVSAVGSGFGLPDIAAAEEHYVELRFGREMRRRYKPGLPFIGKVEAMSTEKSVRVRVKVYDNTTSIYSQDIEISAGEGTFIVPAILADSDVIALQAELVSVEGKEIESHYVLAREPIHKWNSSSDCYLLIEGVEHTLQPDEEAHVAILSTCPCERDLHYVITTDGRVTDWAQRRYEDPVAATAPSTPSHADGAAICRLNFSFSVRSVMAPVSQLLVYYVTPQGEPVSDVISFDVKLLQKQVYVNVEDRKFWYPNQALDVEIVAEHSSLVCLIGGRSGSGNDVKFNPRISDDRVPSGVTGEVDFLEAGVSFFQRQCSRRGGSDVYAVSYRQRGQGAGPASRRRPQESLVGGEPFDRLWLWKCFNYTSELAASGLTLSAPEEAGRWSLWVLTLGSAGLRFSAPVSVTVFRPLQAEFRLPPSLRVGETLEVDVKIGNNINSCMDVTALLALSEGAQFLTNGLLYVTERLRLGPHGATSLVVRILVSTPGLKNMTVEVNGYSSSSCDVIGTTSSNNESLSGAVVRSATVVVHPEGLVRTDTESAYFCANENIVISTADNFKYEWINAPRNRALLVFELRSTGAAHLALSETRYPTDHMYQIALGDSDNAVTWIGRGRHGYGVQLASTSTPKILSADSWRTFWISWERNTISLGKGASPYNHTLLKWKMDKKMRVQHVGFTSLWGIAAQFRIWNYNDEAGFSQVLHLDVPRSVVPGSESGTLLVTGGLALPSTRLLQRAATSLQGAIAALTPLLLIQHDALYANASAHTNIIENLAGHVQNVLSFRNADNSFSEHHLLASHSATLAALEALIKVQAFFSVDPDLIQEIKRWLQLRQEDDGSFIPLPADVNVADVTNQSACSKLDHIIELTADTLVVLQQVGIENEMDSEIIDKSKKYLENNVRNANSSSSISAAALALVLLDSSQSQLAMEILKNYSTTEEGDFGWPHPMPRRDAADWLYESETGRTLKEPIPTSAEDFKASLNALTAFCTAKDMKSAEAVARYLFYRSHMLDHHTELIYSSVKAFASFSALAYDEHRVLTVSLATSGMELTDTLELRNDDSEQLLHLPSLPTKIFVYATGAGCATIQGHTSYSTYAALNQTPLLDLWSKVDQEITADRSSVDEIEGKLPMLKIKTCFRWKSASSSGVLRLEISLFSGYELFSVNPIPSDAGGIQPNLQHGSQANNLWFVFANVTSNCPICVQYVIRSAYVISSLRPAFARVYPASREDLAAETFFHSARGSELLVGITEDDLITWFGKNNSSKNQSEYENTSGCNRTENSTSYNTTPAPTTTQTAPPQTTTKPTAAITDKPRILDDFSVTTYTINVDQTTEVNTSTALNNSTEINVPNVTISAKTSHNSTRIQTNNKISNETLKIPMKIHLLNTLSKPTTVTETTDTTTSTSSNKTILINQKTTTSTKTTKLKSFVKNKLKFVLTMNHTNTKNTGKITAKPELIKNPPSSPTTAAPHEIKHVNKQIQQVPLEYLEDEKLPEDTPLPFPPEDKDKFFVLNKDVLWGMLKEVVHDELDKSERRKNEEEKLSNSQNIT